MTAQKNSAIVCCRTISMIMIVLCHVVHHYTFIPGHDFLGNVLNVGVFSFLAISGYLYGSKTITDYKKWFLQRCMTVTLPALLVSVCVISINACIGNKLDFCSVVLYLFNLQGLGFLHYKFYHVFTEVLVLGPLWFITVIMLCYCLVPLFQKLRCMMGTRNKNHLVLPVAFLLSCAIQWITGIQMVYFLTFVIGYYLAAYHGERCIRIPNFVVLTAVAIAAQILRLVLRAICDGTEFYQNYTLFSHMVLGIWIFLCCMACGNYWPKVMDRIAHSRIILALNDYSFYIFLTHYCFCRGKLNFYELTDNLLNATLGFAAATVLASIVLKRITNYMQKVIKEFC